MYDLLIVLTTQERIVIPKVVGYGICKEKDVFYFDKDKTRNFLPVHSVLYFGLNNLWPAEEEDACDTESKPIGFDWGGITVAPYITVTSAEENNEGE